MSTLKIQPDETITYRNRQFKITHILDFSTVLARDIITGDPSRLPICELQPLNPIDPSKLEKREDLAIVSDEDWLDAQRDFSIIRPLLETQHKNVEMVDAAAKTAGVHRATIYRWIEIAEPIGKPSALLHKPKTGGRGKSRLPNDVEVIVSSVINNYFLTKQRVSPQKACDEVKRLCRNAGIKPPHPNTVRNRVAVVSEKIKLQRRFDSDAAKDEFEPKPGKIPGADWPLAIVQIDHTKLDVIVVDDIDRQPIGRPWITLAIDVFSRMVTGFYVSLDPPGSMSTGLCLAHSILPKEKWLAKYNITTPWPLWGTMNIVHADNAKEFRGNTLKKACDDHSIDLQWRPVARPRYGAHIERLLGTFNKDIHTLPGTTFSNIKERGSYESERHSALTLSELESWLATYVTEVYHQRFHSELLMSPMKKFEQGIFGNGDVPGTGLPPRILDETRLRLDFMPFIRRVVQDSGIVIGHIHYYHDVLRSWINAKDPDKPKIKRKFLVRQDPRDISLIFFYDPELKTYFDIPYRHTYQHPMSLWEYRETLRRLKDEGHKDINEDLIFAAYEKMQTIADEAVKKTKKSRRDSQRKRNHKETVAEHRPTSNPASPSTDFGNVAGPVLPYEDIDEF